MSSVIGNEQAKAIVKEYDTNSFIYPMLKKCHYDVALC
jgi:hypothetical protein